MTNLKVLDFVRSLDPLPSLRLTVFLSVPEQNCVSAYLSVSLFSIVFFVGLAVFFSLFLSVTVSVFLCLTIDFTHLTVPLTSSLTFYLSYIASL